MRRRRVAALLVALSAAVPATILTQAPQAASGLDPIFKQWTAATPGCAVGVARADQPRITRAYGLADLEHDVPNTADTIFEAGSVAKQFTAAAVLVLANDGKLSLDDPARKYVPELPDYGAPLTIRHMLTHTSGLRDWGSLAAISGWPRTTRAHAHAHVLDIVSRQRGLNFPSGTRWSYSNTGYNLAAIIVSRVSGISFADFTRTRLFEPLGLAKTSWRDDHTRVVKGRAVAYSREHDGYHTLMPFENVHGNGGLLTTLDDLLTWNEALDAGRIGGGAFVRALEERGRFANGRAHRYALGLSVGSYRGVREISHGGATAGYRSFLARYPDQRVSVAVLCNTANAAAGDYAHAAADLFVPDLQVPEAAPTYIVTGTDVESLSGLYRNVVTGSPLELVAEGTRLRIARGPELAMVSGSQFTTPDGRTWTLRGARLDAAGETGEDAYERVSRIDVDAAALAEYAGTYTSEEVETSVTVAIEQGALVVRQRPDTSLPLTALYADAFRNAEVGTIIFRRNAQGRVGELSLVQDRVWDLRFVRRGTARTAEHVQPAVALRTRRYRPRPIM